MRAIHFLIFIFCIASFASLSNAENDKDDMDASDKQAKKRTRTEAGLVEDRSCSICNSHDAVLYKLSHRQCGHNFHISCLHKEFLATDPKENVKCRRCKTDIPYDVVFLGLAAEQNPPNGMSFIRERLTAETIENIFKFVIRNNRLDVLRNMIKSKIPFNEIPYFKQHSALVVAVCHGTVEALKILLASGLKFTPEYESDVNVLLCNALFHKKSVIAKHLVSLGADVNRINPISNLGLIQEEIKAGNVEAVKILIENKANVNINSGKKGNPLHMAIENGHDEIVELLLKAGASPEAINQHNSTAFISACFLNKAGAVRLLIEHGCQTGMLTLEGYNAMHFAMISGSLDVVKYLMSLNFSIHREDGTPSYLLHRVTYRRKIEMLKYLLEIGANPYERFDDATLQLVGKDNPDFYGMIRFSDPAIVVAILYNQHELVKTFLDAGVSPNTRIFFNSCSTLLHLAVQKGNSKIAKLLISRGADTNAIDSAGYTPLCYAKTEWVQGLSAYYAEAL